MRTTLSISVHLPFLPLFLLQPRVSLSFSVSALCVTHTCTLCFPFVVFSMHLCFCFLCSFLRVFMCLIFPHLPVNHTSQMWTQKRILHFRTPFPECQWDHDSEALPISLMWLAGQHSGSPEREKEESSSIQKLSFSVCLSYTRTEAGHFNDPLSDRMQIGLFILFTLHSHFISQAFRKAEMAKRQLTKFDLCEYMYMMHWGQTYW